MSDHLHVLLVEDSEDDACLVLRALSQGGFYVIWERVETAEALCTALANSTWDVLISDYRLPQFDAPMALNIVQQHQPDLPFIVVSGTIGEALAVALMKAGAHDYLMKDNLARLPEAVRREVREAQVRVERQQATLELDQTKERLQLAIEGSGIGLWDWTISTGAVTFNACWAEMIGYTMPDLEPINIKTWQHHTHPEDLQQATLLLEQHFRQESQVYECELRMRHQLGHWVWILARGKVVDWDADGNPLRMIGTHLDISDRKRAEMTLNQLNQDLEQRVEQRTAALQQSEARLREAQQVAHLGSWELDLETGKITWSAEIFSIFGLTPDAAEPTYEQLLQDYFPLDERDRFSQLMERAIHHGETYATDLQIIRIDGSPGYIFAKAELIRSATGQVTRLFGIAMDISDRKQVEAQLQQTNAELIRATRLKDEFLANMSHELRTPLNAILGMTEILQEHIFGAINNQQLQALQTIERSSTHLLEVINDILDVAKIESGQMELEWTLTEIHHLCQSSLTFVRQQAIQKRIQLQIELQPDLPNLLIDERRVRQVLINLLNNAIKFTAEGGTVILQARSQESEDKEHKNQAKLGSGSWILLSVSDTGIGIAPDHFKKLFQPFSQINSALNRQYTGTGLGLALVKRIVEMHGGNVSVTSEVKVGSCFTIAFPYNGLSPEMTVVEDTIVPAELDSARLPDTANQGFLILLAEDNEANVSMISSYLEAKGYRLVIANYGQAAIDLAMIHRPDLILMDIQMPGVDGLEAIRQIRANPELVTTPIIALTALVMIGDRERCLEAGANDYLAKPVELKHLVSTIKQLLDL